MFFPRLDSLGIGGFSHDFGSLKGNTSPVMAAFDSLGTVKASFFIMFTLLFGLIFPKLASWLPTDRKKTLQSVVKSSEETATKLLLDEATKQNAGSNADEDHNSMLGVLGENSSFLLTVV